MKPRLITVYIWLTIAALALVCYLFPPHPIHVGGLTLRWPTLSNVLTGKEIGDKEAEPLATDSVTTELLAAGDSDTQEADTTAKTNASAMPSTSIPKTGTTSATTGIAAQQSGTLPHLSHALQSADQQTIRIVHYGDSQIEEDRITSTLRRHLQDRYGGGGVGLIPLHQTIPTLSLRQRLYIQGKQQTTQQGPKRHLVYGLKSMRLPEGDHRYGPMGQVAIMNDSLVIGSEELYLIATPLADKYAPQPHSRVQLYADSSIHMHRAADTIFLQGKGRVYGLSLEQNHGVVMDNIPMRGCIGTVFKQMDSLQLAQFYQATHTHLIILQYGGNAIPQNKQESTIRGICYGLRDQVRYLRAVAPEADIIFIGPSDMLLMNEEGVLWTNPLVPVMDNTLRSLMAREGVPYFSLYHAMGGEGSMLHWQEVGLAGSDGVHFTRSGANRAANMIWKWLEPMLEPMLESLQEPTPPDSL